MIGRLFLLWGVSMGFVACQASPPIPTIMPTTPAPLFLPAISADPAPLPTSTIPPTSIATPLPTPTPTPQSCQSRGQIVLGRYPSTIEGPQRNYRVYLPPCFGQDGRVYPTLYLLHGNIHGDEVWDQLGIDESAESRIANGTLPPFLIVMPDGNNIANTTSGGPNSFEAVLIDELLPHIETTYCTGGDRARRALGGLSRGGYWAFEVGMRHTELFSAIGGHSPAFLDNGEDPAINPLLIPFSADLLTVRWWFDYGGLDWMAQTGQPLYDWMIAEGMDASWQQDETGDHNDAYWQAHSADYLHWYAQNWPLDRSRYPICSP